VAALEVGSLVLVPQNDSEETEQGGRGKGGRRAGCINWMSMPPTYEANAALAME
jgi:hypothetical protein